MFAADVDGDGDTDVLSASFRDNTIAWYENDGQAGFSTHTITTAADGAHSVFAADVDGDGDTDVLSALQSGHTIAWYENDGQAGFSTHTITTTVGGANSVIAADVDGDGDTDVLSASFYDNTIAWYENDGQAGFTPHAITTTASGARSVFAADVDGDGDTDVLSASEYDNTIAWYENDGQAGFSTHTITTKADSAISVFAADVDGDGDTDVLSASFDDDTIAWYENVGSPADTDFNGDGTTDAADLGVWQTDFGQAGGAILADADGDADADGLDFLAWQRAFTGSAAGAALTSDAAQATGTPDAAPDATSDGPLSATFEVVVVEGPAARPEAATASTLRLAPAAPIDLAQLAAAADRVFSMPASDRFDGAFRTASGAAGRAVRGLPPWYLQQAPMATSTGEPAGRSFGQATRLAAGAPADANPAGANRVLAGQRRRAAHQHRTALDQVFASQAWLEEIGRPDS